MGSSLENIKKELANKYLGKAGIHSIGINKAKNTVKIYYDSELSDEAL